MSRRPVPALSCGFALVAMLVMLAGGVDAVADTPAVVSCASGAGSAEFASQRAALTRDEGALDPRLRLADALLAQGCYAAAVHVLEEGEPLHPGNAAIQSRLRDARSMLSEQRYFDGLERAEHAAKLERNVLRCNKLGDIAACDEALRVKPNDGEIVIAKADALVRLNKPADALPLYRHVSGSGGAEAAGIEAKIAAAESQRQALLYQCEHESSEAALQACQVALLRGAKDEFRIHKRKGVLLQGTNRPPQALDAYIAAGRLRMDDEAVSLAIVALTDSTGRKDALALAARGNALLALKRGPEAVQALRQARALAPDSPDINAPLAAAETLARSQARQRAAAAVARGNLEPVITRTAALDSGVVTAGSAGSPEVDEARRYSNASPASRSH